MLPLLEGAAIRGQSDRPVRANRLLRDALRKELRFLSEKGALVTPPRVNEVYGLPTPALSGWVAPVGGFVFAPPGGEPCSRS